MDWSYVIYGGLVLLGLGGIASRWIPGLKTDNVIEESVEEIIKAKTGVNIDLSPDTPEPKDKK